MAQEESRWIAVWDVWMAVLVPIVDQWSGQECAWALGQWDPDRLGTCRTAEALHQAVVTALWAVRGDPDRMQQRANTVLAAQLGWTGAPILDGMDLLKLPNPGETPAS